MNNYSEKLLSVFNPPIAGSRRDPSDPTGRRRLPKCPARSITLAGVRDYLRSQQARALWEEARRSIADKRAWAKAKQRLLPFVCFQGEMAYQGDAAMTSYSGMCCIDIDMDDDSMTGHVRQLMIDDPVIEPLMVFRSPGYGVKVVTACCDDMAGYEDTYRAIVNYIRTAHGIECDEKCRNISRLCFLGYDPQAYLNEET